MGGWQEGRKWLGVRGRSLGGARIERGGEGKGLEDGWTGDDGRTLLYSQLL